MNRMHVLRHAALIGLAALVPAATARAQAAGRWGLQVIACQPSGDMKNNTGATTGAGCGLQYQADLSGDGSFILRPRLDYIFVPGKYDDGTSNANNSASLIVDGLWFVRGQMTGFYLFGGVGVNASRYEMSREQGAYKGTLKGKPAFAFDGGLGYNFNHVVGLEARYFSSNTNGDYEYTYKTLVNGQGKEISGIAPDTSVKLTAFQLALTFRF